MNSHLVEVIRTISIGNGDEDITGHDADDTLVTDVGNRLENAVGTGRDAQPDQLVIAERRCTQYPISAVINSGLIRFALSDWDSLCVTSDGGTV